jgi:hypothetical protein
MARHIAKKQPCKCGHGKAIHHTRSSNGRVMGPCNFPGCKCKDYELTKTIVVMRAKLNGQQ